MIIASAIKTNDGRVFVGKRHGDAMKNAIDILLLNSGGIENEVEIMWIQRADQGFITDKLQFLNRKKALVYAKKTGQFRRNPGPTDYDGPELFSEDLW